MERKDKQKAEKFSVRTDLAIEAREMVREGREEAGEPDGVQVETKHTEDYELTRVHILTELTERQKRVEENHKKGYNCAQAVACAYSDLFGVDEKEAFRAVECFGRGMGVMGTCGAVSAMAYLVGLKVSDANLEKPQTKVDCYDTFKAMSEVFADKNQSTLCSELKGMGTGVVLRSCQGCMADAAEIVEKHLLQENK